MSTDPQTPAWVLDFVEDEIMGSRSRLVDLMLEHGEDVSDVTLWRHRRSQFFSLLTDKAKENSR